MKLTLIKPRIGRQEDSLYIDEGRMEPLQLAVIAGMTPKEIEVVMYDDRMETIPFDEKTDLVAITVETYTARRSYEIATEFRQRGIPVIMGGMHATLLPDEVQDYCDSIVTGDAEWVWQEILEDFQNYRKLKKIYKSRPGIPQANQYLVDRSIYEGKKYLNVGLIQFGRGCKFACSFCAISVFFDKKQYVRRLEDVVAEIKESNKKLFFFVDDNICSDFEALKELCRILIPLKIRWVSQGSLDMTRDLELMDLLVKSGCMGNVMGFETINPSNRKQIRKAPNKLTEGLSPYSKEIDILRNFGLQTWAAFTLGYDHDTTDSINETVEFAIRQKFCFGAFNILIPYPNTDLYRQLEAEKRLLFDGKWWLHPSYKFNHCTFIPKNMTPDQLTEASFKAKEKWNSWNSVFSRYFDFKTHLKNPIKSFIYWRYNPLYSRENFNKQNMYFGLYNHLNDSGQIIHNNGNIVLNPYLSNINEIKTNNFNFIDKSGVNESKTTKL
jgi:radical SAM superfamily enzyme YgiQ (UPF0313 family)